MTSDLYTWVHTQLHTREHVQTQTTYEKKSHGRDWTPMRLDARQSHHRVSTSDHPEPPVEGTAARNEVKVEKEKSRTTHDIEVPEMRQGLSKEVRTELGAGRQAGRGPKPGGR